MFVHLSSYYWAVSNIFCQTGYVKEYIMAMSKNMLLTLICFFQLGIEIEVGITIER